MLIVRQTLTQTLPALPESFGQRSVRRLKGFRFKVWPVHICCQGSCHLLILRGEHLLHRFQLTHAKIVTSTPTKRGNHGVGAGDLAAGDINWFEFMAIASKNPCATTWYEDVKLEIPFF